MEPWEICSDPKPHRMRRLLAGDPHSRATNWLRQKYEPVWWSTFLSFWEQLLNFIFLHLCMFFLRFKQKPLSGIQMAFDMQHLTRLIYMQVEATRGNISLHSVPYKCQQWTDFLQYPQSTLAVLDVNILMKTDVSHTYVSSQFIFAEWEVPPTYVSPPRELDGYPLPTAKVTLRNQHSESSGRSTSGCGM